ncbi:uncharacterized protein LOC143552453 [Bidens hawaiensis]|uniref:uncharacterized protein LOC143552453 n=1 Tax=Bidens hawaiensis TaxID=980011 RepID=UPI00404911E3
MDEEENRIQAIVYKQDIFRFKRFLKESSTLTIVNPSVGLNGSNYRVIDCPNKLVFGPNTHVNPCQDFEGRMFGFKMTSFESVIKKEISLKSAIDIIGHVVHVFETNVSNVKDKNKRTMELCDLNLFDLLIGNDVLIRKPIPPKNIIILGTIKAICQDTEWYYIGCNTCSRKLMENIGEGVTEYECKTERCNVLGVLPTPRFKIKIRVQDSTGVVSLTLFDRDAKMLINKTAAELIDSQKQNEVENGGFPPELDCLLENKFAFKVDVAEFNFRNSVEDYGINKLTDDTNILTELQKRQHSRLQTDSNSVSLGASMSEFQSSGSVSVKIYIFRILEITRLQIQMLMVRMWQMRKGISTSSDDKLKRKLVEVFEVDDQPSMSATKVKPKTFEKIGKTNEACDVATNLTPKLEKDAK